MAASCPLFDKLAPELRNQIYDLVFSDDDTNESARNIHGEIDLTTAVAPPKALLLTCRQAYHEANKLYKSTFRRYWTITRFVVYRSINIDSTIKAIQKIPQRDLEQIKHLVMRSPTTGKNNHVFELVDRRGGWVHKFNGRENIWAYIVSKEYGAGEVWVSSEEKMRNRLDGLAKRVDLWNQISLVMGQGCWLGGS